MRLSVVGNVSFVRARLGPGGGLWGKVTVNAAAAAAAAAQGVPARTALEVP